MTTIAPLQRASVPILVGHRRAQDQLDKLGVSETLVRAKLRWTFTLFQELAGNGPHRRSPAERTTTISNSSC